MSSTKPVKKLVFICSRFPYPIEKGDKLRAYYQLRDLSKYWEIHLIALSDQKVSQENKAKVQEFCKRIYVFEFSKLSGYFRAILGLFGNKPFQIYYFRGWSIQRKINAILQDVQPDHIFAQLIRTAEFVKNHHDCSKTIDYMDVLSAGIEKRISLNKGPLKWLFLQEHRRLQRYEHVIFDYFENRTIISEQDKRKIKHPEKERINVIPNGVAEQFLDFDHNSTEKKFDIAFVGNLSYAPNIEAVKYLTFEILPALEKLGLKARIIISGANPSSSLTSIKDQVEITGWVEDIRMSYISAKIFVAPMFIGTGLQNKLLEALALGLPCVTTPLAHKALDCPEGLVEVAETPDEFAQKILEALANYDEIGARETRQAYVKTHFDWLTINQRLNQILNNVSSM